MTVAELIEKNSFELMDEPVGALPAAQIDELASGFILRAKKAA